MSLYFAEGCEGGLEEMKKHLQGLPLFQEDFRRIRIRRAYHQSCAQPGFRAEKKVPFLSISCFFPVFGAKKVSEKNPRSTLVRA